MSDFFYLEVFLEIGRKKFDAEITEAFVQNAIVQSLNSLFGEFGASLPIDIEKFESKSQGAKFIVRCPSHSQVKLRSSLTLHNLYQSLPCAFHVTRVGSTLLDLVNAKPLLQL